MLLHTWLLLPSRVRLLLYRFLINVGIRIYGRTTSSRTYRLPFNLYAKFGKSVLESEANVMRFLSENTTITVPRVVDCIEVPTGAFIVMTRLPGEILNGSISRMTSDERRQFVKDLGSALRQLHSLSAPDSCVSAFGGGSFRDWRIDHQDRLGPFNSEKEFYDKLYGYCGNEHKPRLRRLARDVHETPHRLCLTHNDLNPRNILIYNNRLSGIVDWECAAWLPEWWEYTRSMYCRLGYQDWIDAMNEAHPDTYPRELEVEIEFWYVSFPW
ncbi:hypothetical protein ACEPAI_377 [Sanghuangporus weigelae]